MSLVDVIMDEAIAVTWVSQAGGAYVDGLWVPAADPAPANIQAAVQPVSGRVLQDLPEGIRSEVTYVGWTNANVAEGDKIGYSAENFKVLHTWPRPQDGFTKFAMGRVT